MGDPSFLWGQRIDEVKVWLALLKTHTHTEFNLTSAKFTVGLGLLVSGVLDTWGDVGTLSLGELLVERVSVERPNLLLK